MPGEGAALQVEVSHSRARAGKPFTLEASFEAPPGITILFGPSGSGKSTILAAIAGLMRPAGGRIALGADVWVDTKAKTFAPVHTRHIAFVFQSLALFPHMTALANVEYGVARSIPREARLVRARETLARMRVGHLENHKPETFSGGEAQRVALARAMAMAPRLVLLDEPFSAMDDDLRRDLAAEVRSIATALAVPIIHVTHHRDEARAIGDRVVLIEHGRVVAKGNTDLLRRVPEGEVP